MSMQAAPLPEEGRVRSLVDFYATQMRTAVVAQLQYRTAQYFYMLGMVAEPVIYLVVWSTIARQHGGAVNGITAGQFAAYYIVSESLNNVAKYAGASRAAVRVRETGERLVVVVEDDGQGGANMDGGTGLRGLVDRVSALDGKLDVDSPSGGGTRSVRAHRARGIDAAQGPHEPADAEHEARLRRRFAAHLHQVQRQEHARAGVRANIEHRREQ